MKAYSQDLRECVIAALETGEETQAEIARRFGLHKSTLEKWWARWRDTGSCAAVVQRHGPPRSLYACEKVIRAEVKQHPDATLAELCEQVADVAQVSISASTMCRELQALQLVRKKSRFTIASRTPRA